MNSGALRVRAPAKINLTLEVVERLPSGYHGIRSIFLKLPRLADSIAVQVDNAPRAIGISSNSVDVPEDESNLCHRAAARYLELVDARMAVHVHIEKAIPVAAGLGGGSSDAAAVLLALNGRFGHRVASADLARVASDIGKDVPFFLTAADVALVSGAGEVIEPLPTFPAVRFLVVNPGIPVATGEAYGTLSRALWYMDDPAREDRSRRMQRAIAASDPDGIAAALFNDFEMVVEARHPIVKQVKQALLAFGAAGALMSGSGPTVFGIFPSERSLERARSALARQYPAFTILSA